MEPIDDGDLIEMLNNADWHERREMLVELPPSTITSLVKEVQSSRVARPGSLRLSPEEREALELVRSLMIGIASNVPINLHQHIALLDRLLSEDTPRGA